MIEITVKGNSLSEIREALNLATNPILSSRISKPEQSIQTPRKMARRYKRWTDIEINQIIHWYTETTFTSKEMAVALERPTKAVEQLLFKLRKKGHLKSRNNYPSRTKTEDL